MKIKGSRGKLSEYKPSDKGSHVLAAVALCCVPVPAHMAKDKWSSAPYLLSHFGALQLGAL